MKVGGLRKRVDVVALLWKSLRFPDSLWILWGEEHGCSSFYHHFYISAEERKGMARAFFFHINL